MSFTTIATFLVGLLGFLIQGAAVGVLFLAARYALRDKSRREAGWAAALAKYGFAAGPSGVMGSVGGRRAFVRGLRVGGKNKKWWTAVEVYALPADVKLEPEAKRALFDFRRPEHVIGDPAFDEAARIGGDAAALGRLSAAAREQYCRLVAEGCEVTLSMGILQVRWRGAETDSARLVRRVDAARAFVAALGSGPPVSELAARVATDPIPAVRATCLHALLAVHPETARRVARDLGPVESPSLRLAVALAVDDSPAVLAAWVDDALPPDERLRRLAAVAAALPDRQIDDALVRLAADGPEARRSVAAEMVARPRPVYGEVARKLLEGLGARAWSGSAWVTVRPERRTLIDLVTLLRDVPDPAAADLLAAAMAAPDDGLRTAAAQALGRCGTVEHVPLLLRVGEEASVLSPGLRAAARSAVDTIQGRTGGTSGTLALAPDRPEAGAVALAATPADRAGDVALAEAPRPARPKAERVPPGRG